jgi:two-component system response regulator AtoC
MASVLIVDDEPQIRRILAVLLSDRGFSVHQTDTGESAIAISEQIKPELVLLDVSLPGIDGLATLRELIKRHPGIICIMLTAFGTIRSAVEAMQIGAFDYLAKPFDNDELLLVIDRSLRLKNLSREVEELRSELLARYGFGEIVGTSPRLLEVFRTISKVAPVDATVLIEGESGTGKELVARAIHRSSPRSEGPFVAVNCGAIPHSLFEAEFFGYERGAFTDAREAHSGRFEQAHGGTIFLDEVGDLPLDSQGKLLRTLQDREIRRLGAQRSVKVDVRVIAATKVELKAALEQGHFRDDLYWRLNVVKIVMPPLRDRTEDVPLIIDHLMGRFNRELSLNVRIIDPAARRLLLLYDWPGNVRELENVICSTMIMCEDDRIGVADLPPRIRGAGFDEPAGTGGISSGNLADMTKMPLTEAVKAATARIEKMMIISRLAELNGNRTATAQSLGISRKSLFNKMRQYQLTDADVDEIE